MLFAQLGHALPHALLPVLVLVELGVVLHQRGDLLIDEVGDILDMVGLLGSPQEQRLGPPDGDADLAQALA